MHIMGFPMFVLFVNPADQSAPYRADRRFTEPPRGSKN